MSPGGSVTCTGQRALSLSCWGPQICLLLLSRTTGQYKMKRIIDLRKRLRVIPPDVGVITRKRKKAWENDSYYLTRTSSGAILTITLLPASRPLTSGEAHSGPPSSAASAHSEVQIPPSPARWVWQGWRLTLYTWFMSPLMSSTLKWLVVVSHGQWQCWHWESLGLSSAEEHSNITLDKSSMCALISSSHAALLLHSPSIIW